MMKNFKSPPGHEMDPHEQICGRWNGCLSLSLCTSLRAKIVGTIAISSSHFEEGEKEWAQLTPL